MSCLYAALALTLTIGDSILDANRKEKSVLRIKADQMNKHPQFRCTEDQEMPLGPCLVCHNTNHHHTTYKGWIQDRDPTAVVMASLRSLDRPKSAILAW